MKSSEIDAKTIQFAGAVGASSMQVLTKAQKAPVKVVVKTIVPDPIEKDDVLMGVQSALQDERALQAANDLLGTSSDKLTDNDLKALFAGK